MGDTILCTKTRLSDADRTILRSYISILDGLAEFWGSGLEIVLHSLEDYDSAAIKVINGHYTGRQEGAPITDLALQMLREIQRNGDNHKNMIYANKSKDGSPIRSATLPIVGENDRIIGLLCINMHMDVPLHQFVKGLFQYDSGSNSLNETFANETFANSSDELIESTTIAAREEVTHNRHILSANRNKEIIRILCEKDIFRFKNSVPKVSEILGVSRNTVYLHLRNLQTDKNG